MKRTFVLIAILLTVYITGCSQNIAAISQQAVGATATLKVVQTPTAASQNETPPTAPASQSAALQSPVTQPAELPTPATQDLSYADNNKYPGMNSPDMAEDNSYVYYCSDAGISKLDKQTGKAQVIYQYEPLPRGVGLVCLSLYQDRIYFIQDSTIRSIDLNGNDLKILFDWDKYIAQSNKQALQLLPVRDPILNLVVDNGSVYFYTDSVDKTNYIDNILELNPINGTLSIFIENAQKVIFNGNYAYYQVKETYNGSDVNEIYKMNIATKKKELVAGKDSPVNNAPNSDGLNVGNFVFANNQLYFTAETTAPTSFQYCLYKYDNSGSIEKLYDLDDPNYSIDNLLNYADSIDNLINYANNLYFIDDIYALINESGSIQKCIIYELDSQTGKCTPISIMGNDRGTDAVGIINNTIIYSDNEMYYIDLKN